jgi:alpha-L-rhamnosidase
LHETGYPYEIHGSFESSKPELEDVAAIGLRALEACSHETYMDCPYYEQLQYVGDTRLEALATYAVTKDDRLPRKAIVLFDLSREPSGLTRSRYPDHARQIIPPFSLYWVAMVHDFAMYKGDPRFIRQCMRGVRSVIDFFRDALDDDGVLVSPSGWNFFDWVGGWDGPKDAGWRFGTPPAATPGERNAIYQFLFAYVLGMVAELETIVGEPELAARAARLAASVREAGKRLFWDDQRGLFTDDPGKRYTSEHAQCFALLAGAVPSKDLARVESALLTLPLARATIYFTHYLFEAYRVLGAEDAMFERLGLWIALRSQGFRTTPESPEPTRSDCHAWGAHPIYHYAATIVGIRPASFGFATFTMKPALGPLSWARAVVPHPAGTIAAEVHRVGSELSGAVRVPSGVHGTLVLGERTVELPAGETRF